MSFRNLLATLGIRYFLVRLRFLDVELPEQFSIIERLEGSYAVPHLCHVFGVHRSSYWAWRDRDKTLSEDEQRLLEKVVDAHASSNGSA